MKGPVLIVDDEPSLLESLELYFRERHYAVACARSISEAEIMISLVKPKVILLDVRLPDGNGLDALRKIKDKSVDCGVIVMTAFHDLETTVNAFKLGACEYVAKPIDVEELERAINRVLERHLSAGPQRAPQSLDSYVEGKIVGKSRAMQEICKAIAKLSQTRVTVLIEGETGTGKELIARAIHYHSPARDRPFVAVNCCAIVGTLLESELFGHERGAFTGAIRTKRGIVEIAGEGTIFLDEISELPLDLQAKLLRFIQEKEFQRVGGEKIIKSNARVIAATNRDLRRMVSEGRFREDLYYRLSVATIKVPPLRERVCDIPLLVDYLLRKINYHLGTQIRGVDEGAMEKLMGYPWPGNVRELENVLTKAALSCQGDVILKDDIVGLLQHWDDLPSEGWKRSLSDVERAHILDVLNHTNWHLGRACEILQISRPTLRAKIKKYGLSREGR